MFLRVEKLAKEMSRLGIRRGSRVGALLPNCPEFIETCLAAFKLGAAFVPVNTRLGIVELETVLKSSRLNLLFYSPSVGGINTVLLLEELQFQLRSVERIFAVLSETLVSKQPFELYEGIFLKEDVETPGRDTTVPEDDPALILYSAGSKGNPRELTLSHRDVVGVALDDSAGAITADDRILPAASFYNAFGFVAEIAGAIAAGAALCIPDNCISETILRSLESDKITVMEGVPSDFAGLLESPLLKRADLSRLRLGMIGEAPCPPSLAAQIRQKLGCQLSLNGGFHAGSGRPFGQGQEEVPSRFVDFK